MSDVTSGFNIAEDISLLPEFHDLCGFWESEVTEVLIRIAEQCKLSPEDAKEAIAMMRTFYNGYRFSSRADGLLYNPTLVLYFLKHLQRSCTYPENMLDENLAMDRGKISYISRLPGGDRLLWDNLNEQVPVTIQRLANRFGVQEMLSAPKDHTFMASLLYYFGVLTLGERTPRGTRTLLIPNLVVRGLYLERIQEMVIPDMQRDEALNVAENFYSTGNLDEVCAYLEHTYLKAFDNRDYKWTNELTIKTIFLAFLFNDLFYIMDSETALQREYADMTMIVRPDMRQFQLLDFLFEFKYIGLKQHGLTGENVRAMSLKQLKTLAPVAAKLAESKTKLEGYRQKLNSVYGDKLRLHVYSVVAIGYDRLVWETIGEHEE
jgi:hypothetical protein